MTHQKFELKDDGGWCYGRPEWSQCTRIAIHVKCTQWILVCHSFRFCVYLTNISISINYSRMAWYPFHSTTKIRKHCENLKHVINIKISKPNFRHSWHAWYIYMLCVCVVDVRPVTANDTYNISYERWRPKKKSNKNTMFIRFPSEIVPTWCTKETSAKLK